MAHFNLIEFNRELNRLLRDYNRLKQENEELKKELAYYKSHADKMSESRERFVEKFVDNLVENNIMINRND